MAAVVALALGKIAGEKIEILKEVKNLESKKANFERTGNVEGKSQVLIVDEASMVGTREMAKIIDYSRNTNTRLVIQGDGKQFGSVSGGRAFEQLKEAGLLKFELAEATRFKTEQTRNINKALNNGNYEKAVELSTIKEVGISNKLDQKYSKIANDQQLYKAAAKEYARTNFGTQGRTVDIAIAVIGESGTKMTEKSGVYVAMTRARDSVTVLTTDKDALLRNANRISEKTTALDAPRVEQGIRPQPVKTIDSKKQQVEKSL